VRSLFDRDSYSSLLIRPASDEGRNALVKQVEEDKRLQLLVKNEVDYYKEQTMTATPIKWMGNFLATAMSLGAILAAMNTMYATVGARTREIGTLRVLGFRRRTIVLGLLIEGILLCGIGGAWVASLLCL
jgi:putative ABC transport system permease protein